MSSKRSAPDSGFSFSEENRKSKRFKASPATALINSVKPHVTGLLRMIQMMPSDLIIVGLDNAINGVLDEALLATPATYDNTLKYLDSQIEGLTEAKKNGKVEAKYAFLTKGMEAMLKGELKRISMAH
jgi:hypothetical protein